MTPPTIVTDRSNPTMAAIDDLVDGITSRRPVLENDLTRQNVVVANTQFGEIQIVGEPRQPRALRPTLRARRIEPVRGYVIFEVTRSDRHQLGLFSPVDRAAGQQR